MAEKWSTDDLYLAFRQAKLNTVLERRGTELVKFSSYEESLARNLGSLHEQIDRASWFDNVELGEVLLAPKGFHDDTSDGGSITRIGRISPSASRVSVSP